jgi:hypothetical protein
MGEYNRWMRDLDHIERDLHRLTDHRRALYR